MKAGRTDVGRTVRLLYASKSSFGGIKMLSVKLRIFSYPSVLTFVLVEKKREMILNYTPLSKHNKGLLSDETQKCLQGRIKEIV